MTKTDKKGVTAGFRLSPTTASVVGGEQRGKGHNMEGGGGKAVISTGRASAGKGAGIYSFLSVFGSESTIKACPMST